MCFSAGASFGASAVVGVIGVVAIVKAKSPAQRVFATIPLLFAVQQFAEGMLWLSFKNPSLESLQPFFTYTFLVFAMMFWPFWIPFTIRLLEENEKQKKLLNILVSLGLVITVGIAWVLVKYPVQVMANHNHIHYAFDIPPGTRNIIWLFTILYCMTTIVSPFISSIKRMRCLGMIFLASWMFAIFLYQGFVVSIWCFFAAAMSGVVLWILSGNKKEVLGVEIVRG